MRKLYYGIGCILCACMLFGCGAKAPKAEPEEVVEEEITTEATTKELTEYTLLEDRTTETVTEEASEEAAEQKTEKKMLIAIDPGHQGPNVDMSASEPNAPGSSEMKRKATEGTTGKFTGVGEYQLNLDISLKLRDALVAEGYDVIMTREDNDTAISNAERATLANDAGADFTIRIHANGDDDSSANGALAIIGSESNEYVGSVYDESKSLGEAVLNAYCESTGMKNLGIQTSDTMTGINWSTIPVMILEMGFMSNQTDDENMQDLDYQEKMVQGIVNGINEYTKDKKSVDLGGMEQVLNELGKSDAVSGMKASIYVEDLKSGESASFGGGTAKSASLIKLYVAGCVYENKESLNYDGIDDLVKKMLSRSDNDATNTLVKYLGDGDAQKGISRVNVYCERHGFINTSMGRLMLDFDSTLDNYTSVADCGKFLRMLYNKELTGSEEMLEALYNQERRSKIPAGVSGNAKIANKTGELDDVENDVAIVCAGRDYILCITTSDFQDGAAAREWITEVSAKVYEYYTNN